MTKRKLAIEGFDWTRWSSDKHDLPVLGRTRAARMYFQMCLVNRFEQEVLRLKEQDCVWGPVHSSIGQEAEAAAAIAGLRRTDRITGSHRAHHLFLCKALNYVLPDDWNPLEADFPEPGQRRGAADHGGDYGPGAGILRRSAGRAVWPGGNAAVGKAGRLGDEQWLNACWS